MIDRKIDAFLNVFFKNVKKALLVIPINCKMYWLFRRAYFKSIDETS